MKVKQFIEEEITAENLPEKLVRELFYLAMEINTVGKYYCFFHLSPHVSAVGFHITSANDYEKILYNELGAYYKNKNFISEEEVIAKLTEAKKILLAFLQNDLGRQVCDRAN